MTDVRILGKFGLSAEIEELALDLPRWLLCSRDFARGGLVSAAAQGGYGGGWWETFPPANCLDGNRLSYLLTDAAVEYIDLVIDTGGMDRKAMLFLEWPEGELLAVNNVWGSNDGNSWNEILPVTLLFQGQNFGLWRLPVGEVEVSQQETVHSYLAGYLKYYLSVLPEETQQGADYWNGGELLVQSGPYGGQVRQIMDWALEDPLPPPPTEPLGLVTIDVPFMSGPDPQVLSAGTYVLLRKRRPGYLRSRYMKVRVLRQYSAGLLPIQLHTLSLFDYYVQLKGDLGSFRRLRAPNPTRAGRSSNPTGLVHPCLSGPVFEQRSGPKRRVEAEWGVSYPGFAEWFERWAGAGEIGLVDEEYRFMSGYVEPDSLSWEALPADKDGNTDITLRAVFREA